MPADLMEIDLDRIVRAIANDLSDWVPYAKVWESTKHALTCNGQKISSIIDVIFIMEELGIIVSMQTAHGCREYRIDKRAIGE